MSLKHIDDNLKIFIGDVFDGIDSLEDESVDCVVTSPPYWNLRNYGVDGQIGTEDYYGYYIEDLALVFKELLRVVKPTGSLWLNIGDTYQNKEILFIPAFVALAVQESGWKARAELVWHKNNPLPESAKDRPTRSHEMIYFFTKTFNYYWDKEAASEPAKWERWGGQTTKKFDSKSRGSIMVANRSKRELSEKFDTSRRNMRSVWHFPTQPYRGFHAAAFPEELPRRAILASCPSDGVVLDPFAGSGTTLKVALDLGRKAIGIDLQEDYLPLMLERCGIDDNDS